MTNKNMPATDFTQVETYRHTLQQRLQRDLEAREAQRQKALQAVLETALVVLKAYPSVRRAYLFGSVIRPGNFYPDSDIDIALEGATAVEYFAVWRDLEHALSEWAVDVREITDPSPFTNLIRETGVLIYERASSSTSG